jgi:hypothetical protein
MTASRASILLVVVAALGLGTFLSTPEAHAQNGTWTWGTPGWSRGLSPGDINSRLVTQGLADPLVQYYTPFWQGNGPNYNIATPDTGYRNTFSVNHDINASFGIPILGYLDIFTPLLGTNELAIAAAISSLWTSIVDTVSQVWNSITSIFQSDYTSYSDYGSYGDYDFDNGFDVGFGDYGGGGGGCFTGGGGGLEENLMIEDCF